jgi:hypothetical protein
MAADRCGDPSSTMPAPVAAPTYNSAPAYDPPAPAYQQPTYNAPGYGPAPAYADPEPDYGPGYAPYAPYGRHLRRRRSMRHRRQSYMDRPPFTGRRCGTCHARQ